MRLYSLPDFGRGNGDLLQRDLCQHAMAPRTVVISGPDPVAGHCQRRLCRRLLDTHRQVQLSLLWGHCSFLLVPGAHGVFFVPSKSLFPQSCGSSIIKSHWPSKSYSLGVLSAFARSLGWGSRKLFCSLWVICSAALWWVTLRDPGLLQPQILSQWQATADPCLHRKHSNTQSV